MTATDIVYFLEDDGMTPVQDWLEEMYRRDERIVEKCLDRIELLAERGYQLQRPFASRLRNGIYEIRVRFGSVNYRILYFFHENKAVLAHGLTKEAEVPDKDIALAVQRKNKFVLNPKQHTSSEELE